MKHKKRGILIGCIVIAILLLFTAIFMPRIHGEKVQAKQYLDPLIKEGNLLCSSIQQVTGKKNNDFTSELTELTGQFDAFLAAARNTKHMTGSEIDGFLDFESILGHCQSRIRVMTEAVQKGQALVPDEISFLNTLNRALGELTGALKNEDGSLRVTQYSEVIGAFTEAIRNSDR